jgi:hypothetical protein
MIEGSGAVDLLRHWVRKRGVDAIEAVLASRGGRGKNLEFVVQFGSLSEFRHRQHQSLFQGGGGGRRSSHPNQEARGGAVEVELDPGTVSASHPRWFALRPLLNHQTTRGHILPC